MITETKQVQQAGRVKVITPALEKMLLERCNTKYKALVLLMLDGGLRVSETVSLQVKSINTMLGEIQVRSRKKRKKIEYRKIPITERMMEAIVNWYKTLKDKSPDAYLFPSKQTVTGHMSRKVVHHRIKLWTDQLVGPHMLRHTYASRIVSNSKDMKGLVAAKELLGHADIRTTQIYMHSDRHEMIEAVRRIENRHWRDVIQERLFPKKRVHIVPFSFGDTKFHVGRKAELLKLADAAHRKINTIILGPQGIGKTHIIDNYDHGNYLRLDIFEGSKKFLLTLLMEIVERDPERAGLMYQEDPNDLERIRKIILKKTSKYIIEDLIRVTQRHEFTLLIDDVTRITPGGVTALEKLRNHFHIICAARQLPLNKSTFLTNFQRIDLRPLNYEESCELIGQLSTNLIDRVEDYKMYRNHIWEATNGVPQFIYEMVERYAKEPDISTKVTREINHTAAKTEMNFLPFFVGVIACMSVMRYWGKITGTDSGPFYLLSAIGVIFLFFGREIVKGTKRKYL